MTRYTAEEGTDMRFSFHICITSSVVSRLVVEPIGKQTETFMDKLIASRTGIDSAWPESDLMDV